MIRGVVLKVVEKEKCSRLYVSIVKHVLHCWMNLFQVYKYSECLPSSNRVLLWGLFIIFNITW